jgi:hypothetical protein
MVEFPKILDRQREGVKMFDFLLLKRLEKALRRENIKCISVEQCMDKPGSVVHQPSKFTEYSFEANTVKNIPPGLMSQILDSLEFRDSKVKTEIHIGETLSVWIPTI